MRKVLAILSFCCLLLVTGGYHLLIYLRIAEAKSEMKKNILNFSKADISRFVFSDAELAALEWEEDSEFKYEGKMYDILEKITGDGQTIIHCISDEKETNLVDAYVNAQKQSSGKGTLPILKLLSVQYISVNPDIEFTAKILTTKAVEYYSILLPSSTIPIETPPPKVA